MATPVTVGGYLLARCSAAKPSLPAVEAIVRAPEITAGPRKGSSLAPVPSFR
jgi:hypothetical protein